MTTYTLDSDVFGFQWSRDAVGYEFRGITDTGSYAEAVVVGVSGKCSPTVPRAKDDLHRIFAQLDNDPSAILAFINEWGLLTKLPDADDGEAFAFIIKQREKINFALHLIDSAERLIFTAAGKKKRSEGDDEEVSAIAKYIAGAKEITAEDIGMFFSPSLDVKLKSARTKYKTQISLALQPHNLLSSMWLQVFEELTSGASFRYCRHCKKIMRIGPGHFRADKYVCSRYCGDKWRDSQKLIFQDEEISDSRLLPRKSQIKAHKSASKGSPK